MAQTKCPHCGKMIGQTTFVENPKVSPQTSLKHPAPVVADEDDLIDAPKAKQVTPKKKA